MKYTMRMLLGIYSPALLANGAYSELMLFWFSVRMTHFALYRWFIGPSVLPMYMHYEVHCRIATMVASIERSKLN